MHPIYHNYQNRKLSVIVPLYKEGAIVQKNIEILENELHQYFNNYEVIAVVDNGKDETYQRMVRLQTLYPRLRVYEYGCNQGKGFALQYGFQRSNGDYIIFIDGDMNLHPKDIKVFLGLMDMYESDIVIGSKRHPQSAIEYPLTRRMLSWGYQLFIRLFLNLNVKDTQVGLKLFKREVLEQSLPRIVVKKYAFDLELLAVAQHLKFTKILEAPVQLNYFTNHVRTMRGRIQDLRRVICMAFRMFVDTLAIIYRLRILRYYDQQQVTVVKVKQKEIF